MSKKQVRSSTAKKIKDLTNYAGEVALFELSKGIKKGPINHKYVIVVRNKPTSGQNNTSIWLANEAGTISYTEPVKEMFSDNMQDALSQFGYKYL